MDVKNNTVTLGKDRDLYSREAIARDFHWICGEPPRGEIRCRVKVRYRQPGQWACVFPTVPDTVRIVFDEP